MRRRLFLAGAGFAALVGAAAAQTVTVGGRAGAGALGLTQITPENPLERAFLAAFASEAERPAFRRALLIAPVAMALSNSAEEAPAFIGPRAAAMLFTSPDRLNHVLGPASPRRVLAGRTALSMLANNQVVLNYRLLPMLTLEPADVAAILALPEQ